MGKRTYSATFVNDIDLEGLIARAKEFSRFFVCLDIAKELDFVCVESECGERLGLWKFEKPRDLPKFLELVEALPGEVEIVMEPSGTYGDSVRATLQARGFEVYQIDGKQVHDVRGVFDKARGMHDAKAATIIAELHRMGLSEPWRIKDRFTRQLTAEIKLIEVFKETMERCRGQLEGMLGRYWPKLTSILTLGSPTQLALLSEYGGPEAVADDPEGAARLLWNASRGALSREKINEVIDSAEQTFGMSMVDEERNLLQQIAQHFLDARRRAQKIERRIKKLVNRRVELEELVSVAGAMTAAILYVDLGAAHQHPAANTYVKAAGMNLWQMQSGKYHGPVHISKRGPGRVRKYLWMLALRMIQSDPIVRAWYRSKVRRDGGTTRKAVVAVARKLLRGLWHVGRGAEFDARLLFDVPKLERDLGIDLSAA